MPQVIQCRRCNRSRAVTAEAPGISPIVSKKWCDACRAEAQAALTRFAVAVRAGALSPRQLLAQRARVVLALTDGEPRGPTASQMRAWASAPAADGTLPTPPER